ncbi:FmdB family zinc ribbon protein [Demequina sp. SO4-18]|uniref:FmdB family zinc ribbon protein n=1 Tax=Demequina sp. SO4-18 TaxID=3401026 RepID=UPI003B5A1354
MPTYVYACRACGHRFDAVQSIHDDSLNACPECEGALRRVFGTVGVTFKGSGFYRNDSRAAAKESSGS